MRVEIEAYLLNHATPAGDQSSYILPVGRDEDGTTLMDFPSKWFRFKTDNAGKSISRAICSIFKQISVMLFWILLGCHRLYPSLDCAPRHIDCCHWHSRGHLHRHSSCSPPNLAKLQPTTLPNILRMLQPLQDELLEFNGEEAMPQDDDHRPWMSNWWW